MTAPADTDARTGPQQRMRCSDADRLAVVHRLQDAAGRGQLTLEECDERTAAAYAARYLDELPGLTADLPDPGAAPPAAPGWRAVASAAALQIRVSLLGAPTWAAADQRRRRLVLLAGVVLTLLLIVLLTAAAVAGPQEFAVDHPRWHGRDGVRG